MSSGPRPIYHEIVRCVLAFTAFAAFSVILFSEEKQQGRRRVDFSKVVGRSSSGGFKYLKLWNQGFWRFFCKCWINLPVLSQVEQIFSSFYSHFWWFFKMYCAKGTTTNSKSSKNGQKLWRKNHAYFFSPFFGLRFGRQLKPSLLRNQFSRMSI